MTSPFHYFTTRSKFNAMMIAWCTLERSISVIGQFFFSQQTPQLNSYFPNSCGKYLDYRRIVHAPIPTIRLNRNDKDKVSLHLMTSMREWQSCFSACWYALLKSNKIRSAHYDCCLVRHVEESICFNTWWQNKQILFFDGFRVLNSLKSILCCSYFESLTVLLSKEMWDVYDTVHPTYSPEIVHRKVQPHQENLQLLQTGSRESCLPLALSSRRIR